MSHASDRRHIDHLLAWLRERELDFELAANSAGLGVWQWNLRTDKVIWSARCRELLGVAPPIPPSLEAFFAVVHPDDREQLLASADLARHENLTRGHEFRIVLADGSVRWLHSAWRTHMDHRTDAPLQALGVLLDVSERHLQEDARQGQELQSQARLWAEAFLHNTRGIAVGDPTTQSLVAVNPAYASLLGWTPRELDGHAILGLYPAAEHARILTAMRAADERGAATLQTCQLHRDGTLIPVELSLVAVRDGEGRLTSRIA
ncbi:MAG TPA: PAS domain-containing protein, partial [Steroidobacteraceae bacterium]|nr:PAS domain-containing protein [Steroidobacteraceae bacterium]